MAQPERSLQKSVVAYIKLALPTLLFTHPPNGGTRNIIEAANFKKMGVLPGTPDLLFWWKGGFGAIELKAGKGRLTEYQQEFRRRFIEAGGFYFECRSIDEVKSAFETCGLLPINNPT